MTIKKVIEQYAIKNLLIEEFIENMKSLHNSTGDDVFHVMELFLYSWEYSSTVDGRMISITVVDGNYREKFTCGCLEWTEKYLMIKCDNGRVFILDSEKQI